MINLNKKSFIISLILVFGFCLCILKFRSLHNADQAKFNVDVLGRFIEYYYAEKEYYPASLNDLPDFNVVSFRLGLAADSSLKNKQQHGYRYDYRLLKKSEYVLSASPVGLFAADNEYGMTQKGLLRSNRLRVDPQPDSADEINRWDVVKRIRQLHTRL